MVGIESVRASLSPFLAELGLDASSYTIKSTGPMPSRRSSSHSTAVLGSRPSRRVRLYPRSSPSRTR
eukprot:1474151-Pyramimonas_sp.AAC.1